MTEATQLEFPLQELLDRMEAARAQWIAVARAEAEAWCREHPRSGITVDTLRRLCPLPEGWDGRIYGAVLRAPTFVPIAHERSTRRESHHRPIRRFVLGDSCA